MSHDGKYAITPNNGDETISIIDLKANKVAATLEAGPEHDWRQLRRRQGVRHQLDQRVRLRLRHEHAEAGGPDQRSASNIQLETATTDAADEKLYLAESTDPLGRDHRRQDRGGRDECTNVGLFPWGTHIMDSKDNYCH